MLFSCEMKCIKKKFVLPCDVLFLLKLLMHPLANADFLAAIRKLFEKTTFMIAIRTTGVTPFHSPLQDFDLVFTIK